MKRYVKGLFGGLLAIMAAFGWCVALVVLVSLKSQDTAVGFYIQKNQAVWVVPFLIFAVGFYLAFRSVYRPNSK